MPDTFGRMLVAESGNRHTDKNGRVVRSPKGAVGIAQVMPATGPEAARDAGLPWDPVRFERDPDYNRALGKAYHAKLLRMFDGDERKAVAAYNAGPGRVQRDIRRGGANWEQFLPDETKDYLAKVTGDGPTTTSSGGGTYTPREIPKPKLPTVEQMLGSTPGELFGEVDQELREIKREPTPARPSVTSLTKDILTEGMTLAPVDMSLDTSELEQRDTARAEQAELDEIGHWDRFKAGMEETLLGELIDALDRQSFDEDPDFNQFYLKNWRSIESFAQSDREIAMIRDAKSPEHLADIQREIEEDREREKIISTASSPTALLIGTGLLDPVGWAAGLGVGKAFQVAGQGSRAYAIAGRPVASVASGAAEGAVGNLAVTAGLDATGDYVDASEYALSVLTGLGIGVIATGVSNTLGRNGIADAQIEQARVAREQHIAGIAEQVRNDLGPDADEMAVAEAVNDRVRKDYLDVLNYALADIPEHQRLGLAEEALAESEAFQARIAESGDLQGVADATERAMVEETTARAIRIDEANPVDRKALRTFLGNDKLQLEATSTRLLLSDSPVARAVAVTLLENPQGAAGRHRTAAITALMRERVYNEQFHGYDALSNQFSRRNNIGPVKDFLTGEGRTEFNNRVFREVERRGSPNYIPDENPFVVQGADTFEAGMEKMRIEQQRAGTIGNARLGDSSVGYAPHRLDPRKVLALSSKEMAAVRGVLSRQFQEIEGFDAKFSDQLAARYLERGVDAANGMYQVPFNLHSPEAGQVVRDALEAMRMDPAEIDKIMGKFSRGGAGHTKRRLKLDLDEQIGDGKRLMDIFVTDMPALYRSYARRVSGEVSLAQYGVMGKKGLDILKKSMIASGATPKEVAAFDQIAAEFLNTPFGEARWNWMDNLRLATSASRLGGMAFTQFAEFGNAIPSLGVQAAFRTVRDLPRMMQEVRSVALGHTAPNDLLRSLDQMGGGVGMDDYWMTRMFDVRDNDVELYNGGDMGIVTRAVRSGAHANMVLSGHRMILASQTRLMSEEILRKAVKYARSGKADEALDDMGIHPQLRDAIRADLDNIATFDGKGRLTGLDLFKGKALTPQMVNELTQAVERGAAQIIQRTFTGETGKWAHNGFLKLLLQFRTFSVTAVEKQWGRNARNYGAMKSFMYLRAAMSFAAPIYMARTGLKAASMDDSKRGEYLEKNLSAIAVTRATLNYASSAGLSGDIMDLGVGTFSHYGGDWGEALADTYSVRGKRSDQLWGGVVAPSAGLAQDAFSGVFTGDPHKIIRSMPGSNLPYVAPFITALREIGEEDD